MTFFSLFSANQINDKCEPDFVRIVVSSDHNKENLFLTSAIFSKEDLQRKVSILKRQLDELVDESKSVFK